MHKTEKHPKNKTILKRTEIKDSPFTIIERDGKYFGTMGKYQLTTAVDTFAQAKKELTTLTWDRIIQVTILLIEELKQQELDIKKLTDNDN